MKETILDLADKLIRVLFYSGIAVFFSIKSILYFAQFADYPRLLMLPAVLVIMIWCWIIVYKIIAEPTPKARRAAQEKTEKLEALLKYYKEGYK
jgi:hypothetical protein